MQDTNPEVAELLRALRRLRASRGNPTLEGISRRTQGYVSTATLSRLFSGRFLPSERVVMDAVVALFKMEPAGVGVDVPLPGKFRKLYEAARRAQLRARPTARIRGSGPGRPAHRMPGDAGLLQESLWELIREQGLTLSELSRRLHVAKSTLSDALRHGERLPDRELVRRIAAECGVSAEPYLRMLAELQEARLAAAEKKDMPKAPSAEETMFWDTEPPRDPQVPPGLEVSSPEDVLVAAAVTRPPEEIAALVAGLKANGQAAFAARVVHEAAASRSIEDVTTLALALLATDSAGTVAGAPQVPAQDQRSSAARTSPRRSRPRRDVPP